MVSAGLILENIMDDKYKIFRAEVIIEFLFNTEDAGESTPNLETLLEKISFNSYDEINSCNVLGVKECKEISPYKWRYKGKKGFWCEQLQKYIGLWDMGGSTPTVYTSRDNSKVPEGGIWYPLPPSEGK